MRSTEPALLARSRLCIRSNSSATSSCISARTADRSRSNSAPQPGFSLITLRHPGIQIDQAPIRLSSLLTSLPKTTAAAGHFTDPEGTLIGVAGVT
jgi:hypothetical protein